MTNKPFIEQVREYLRPLYKVMVGGSAYKVMDTREEAETEIEAYRKHHRTLLKDLGIGLTIEETNDLSAIEDGELRDICTKLAKALLSVDAVCKLHTIELSEENIADKEAIMAYGRLVEKIRQAIEGSGK